MIGSCVALALGPKGAMPLASTPFLKILRVVVKHLPNQSSSFRAPALVNHRSVLLRAEASPGGLTR